MYLIEKNNDKKQNKTKKPTCLYLATEYDVGTLQLCQSTYIHVSTNVRNTNCIRWMACFSFCLWIFGHEFTKFFHELYEGTGIVWTGEEEAQGRPYCSLQLLERRL